MRTLKEVVFQEESGGPPSLRCREGGVTWLWGENNHPSGGIEVHYQLGKGERRGDGCCRSKENTSVRG